jgi:spermidine/putrescine transport system ATP-binding protein
VHVTHDQEEAMTMADTIAVMNAGAIEQMGDPLSLYDNPATTFVSNFLGQSNLVRGVVRGRVGDEIVVDVHGTKVGVPEARAHQAEGEVWVGVRPEKVYLAAAGVVAEDSSNVLRGGTITDVSFVGVSTQYLIRLPWGQELTVFEQNTGARQGLRVGDAADLHWMASHTFLLDAAQDASAGAQPEDVS